MCSCLCNFKFDIIVDMKLYSTGSGLLALRYNLTNQSASTGYPKIYTFNFVIFDPAILELTLRTHALELYQKTILP
jgi:hypothetical protein